MLKAKDTAWLPRSGGNRGSLTAFTLCPFPALSRFLQVDDDNSGALDQYELAIALKVGWAGEGQREIEKVGRMGG